MRMAPYGVRVTGLSTVDSPEQWVRLLFVGLGGRHDERYFRSADIVASPKALFEAASGVGIPLLRPPSKNDALLALYKARSPLPSDPLIASERGGHMRPAAVVNWFASLYRQASIDRLLVSQRPAHIHHQGCSPNLSRRR